MAAVKKLNTPYTIDTTDVTITGNLTVLGMQTAIETTNTTLKDNTIVLNDGETGAGVTLGTAGVLVSRGTLANVSLRWVETFTKWQITNDGTNYSNIATSSTGLTAVIDDASPSLGGNLNTYGRAISSNVGGVIFDDTIQVNYSSAPSAVTNAIGVYTSAPNSAGSGVYVVNTNGTDELVTKTKAIVFSLIL